MYHVYISRLGSINAILPIFRSTECLIPIPNINIISINLRDLPSMLRKRCRLDIENPFFLSNRTGQGEKSDSKYTVKHYAEYARAKSFRKI